MNLSRVVIAAVVACLLSLSSTCLGQQTDWERLMSAGDKAMAGKQYSQAEDSYRQAVEFAESHWKKDARQSASLMKLAESCNAQSKVVDAEALAKRAVTAMAEAMKAHKPTNASEELDQVEASATLFSRAGELFATNDSFADAESFYQRVIADRENYANRKPPANPTNEDFLRLIAQGASNSQAKVADAEDQLGGLYVREKKFPEAEQQFRRSEAIREKMFGADQPPVAQSLSGIARCYALREQYEQAQPIYKRIISILDNSKFRDTVEMAAALENYGLVLRKSGNEVEAQSAYDKAREIRTRVGRNSTH